MGYSAFNPDDWQPPEDSNPPAKVAKVAKVGPENDRSDAAGLAALAGLAGLPATVAAGLALLWSKPCPRAVDPKEWRRIVADCQRFVTDGWLEKALAAGWEAPDLFGVAAKDRDADAGGLCLLLDGRRVCAIGPTWAAIELAGGGRLYLYRKDRHGERLLWALGRLG